MKIWRGVFLNKIEELDKDNFGIHWTIDWNYPYSIEFFNNNISNNNRIGNRLFIFEAKIENHQVNKLKTEISNRDYPSESEIILNVNLALSNVRLINQGENNITIDINTGFRADSWINKT